MLLEIHWSRWLRPDAAGWAHDAPSGPPSRLGMGTGWEPTRRLDSRAFGAHPNALGASFQRTHTFPFLTIGKSAYLTSPRIKLVKCGATALVHHYTNTDTHCVISISLSLSIYIYIYIYVCVCVCVCVCMYAYHTIIYYTTSQATHHNGDRRKRRWFINHAWTWCQCIRQTSPWHYCTISHQWSVSCAHVCVRACVTVTHRDGPSWQQAGRRLIVRTLRIILIYPQRITNESQSCNDMSWINKEWGEPVWKGSLFRYIRLYNVDNGTTHDAGDMQVSHATRPYNNNIEIIYDIKSAFPSNKKCAKKLILNYVYKYLVT